MSTKVPHSGYKFKGKGEFEYHLGCDIGRDRQKTVIRISVCDNISEKLLIGKHKPPWKAKRKNKVLIGLLNSIRATGSPARGKQ